MTNQLALILGALILGALVFDHYMFDQVNTIFLLRKFADFTYWLAFWR